MFTLGRVVREELSDEDEKSGQRKGTWPENEHSDKKH